MGKLTMRSKVRVFWTTNPADMGYAGTPTGGEPERWKNPVYADYELCSMRKALDFNYQLGQQIGQGTYRKIAYFHCGREIERDDIEYCVGLDYTLRHEQSV